MHINSGVLINFQFTLATDKLSFLHRLTFPFEEFTFFD